MNFDLTQTVTKDNLIMEPFPHFKIVNALPWNLYDQLSNEFPESHIMSTAGWYFNGDRWELSESRKTNFKARRYRQHEFESRVLSALWKEFIDYHNSLDYKNRVVDLFEPGIEKYYNKYKDRFRDMPVSRRQEDIKPNTLAMELQFVLNGLQETTVRTIHLDNPKQLFAGLLYMRKPEDTGIGGDLQIFKKNTDKPEFTGFREINPDHVDLVDTVHYRANTMFLFLNTIDTLHGVTPRTQSNCFRRYINVDAHQDQKLFTVE